VQTKDRALHFMGIQPSQTLDNVAKGVEITFVNIRNRGHMPALTPDQNKGYPMQNTDPVKILIIDDEPAIVRMLSIAFTKKGYVTDIAENGRQGIKKSHPITMISSSLMSLCLMCPADRCPGNSKKSKETPSPLWVCPAPPGCLTMTCLMRCCQSPIL
jgi:hypothetical protein